MEVNLKESLDDISAFVKSLPGKYFVKEYEGEYDDNDWTEKHPSCLIEISSMTPAASGADKNMIAERIDFLLLIGGNVNAQKHPLEISSEIISALDGQEFLLGDVSYYANFKSINFFARNKSLKIYALRWEMAK